MLLNRTQKMVLLLVIGIATIAVGLTRAASVASQATPDAEATIESAMGAGPASITENATIMDVDGTTVLREGSNGWTCFPDQNASPASDPMCLDETWLGWLQALVAGEEPDTQVVGLAYMLAGGSDASNVDPYATGPEEGNEWITTPAHVMVIMPGDIDQSVYTTDPLSGEPWIMWAGTPYEHVMVPVDPHGAAHGGEMGGMAMATPSS